MTITQVEVAAPVADEPSRAGDRPQGVEVDSRSRGG